jgi:hypothetical protein
MTHVDSKSNPRQYSRMQKIMSRWPRQSHIHSQYQYVLEVPVIPMATVLLLEGEARPRHSRVCAFVVRRDGRVGQIGDSLENTTGARGYEHLLVPAKMVSQ